MKRAPVFQRGDRIAYSAAYLKSTVQVGGYAPKMRGTVTEVTSTVSESAGVYFTYRPDGGAEDRMGLSCNFTLVSRIAQDAALA